MKLFGVIASAPGQEERHFLVLTDDPVRARQEVIERLDDDTRCSLTLVPGERLLAEHDGCAELWS